MFCLKILEKVVANRLQAYIKITIYLTHYRQPERNITVSMDKDEAIDLTLLDMLVAFDTIVHATLTNRLSDCCGILHLVFF